MATYSKALLSESVNGKQIIVDTDSSPGTLIHTAVAGTGDLDEVWLYAINADEISQELTLEWGGTDAPDDQIVVVLPAYSGLYLLVPGLLLQNSLSIRCYASGVDVIMISGFVNRISG